MSRLIRCHSLSQSRAFIFRVEGEEGRRSREETMEGGERGQGGLHTYPPLDLGMAFVRILLLR